MKLCFAQSVGICIGRVLKLIGTFLTVVALTPLQGLVDSCTYVLPSLSSVEARSASITIEMNCISSADLLPLRGAGCEASVATCIVLFRCQFERMHGI